MNPSQFAEMAFGWKAFDYQKAPLDDMNRNIIQACGRQVGNPKRVH